jgi:hypothetical protein
LYHFSKEILTKLLQAYEFQTFHASIPLIHPVISNSLENYLQALQLQEDLNKRKYVALSIVNKLVA